MSGINSRVVANDPSERRLSPYGPVSDLLDAVNLRLLAGLCEDARISIAALARNVGMSAPAVAERIRRLEEAGVIRGYHVDLDPGALGLPLMAIVRVRPNAGRLPDVAALASRMAEVLECHRVTGDDCFVLKVLLPAIDALDVLLDQLLLYGTTTTSIVQSSPVPPRLPPLPAGPGH